MSIIKGSSVDNRLKQIACDSNNHLTDVFTLISKQFIAKQLLPMNNSLHEHFTTLDKVLE